MKGKAGKSIIDTSILRTKMYFEALEGQDALDDTRVGVGKEAVDGK